MNWNFKPIASICCIAVVMATACTSDPNSPGVEYMPDMYRSHAVEAYIDYDHIEKSSVRKPVPGTISFMADSSMRYNVLPYIYPNTPAGYEAAGTGLSSPLVMTAGSLEEGKVLFNKFCMHCHGEQGLGDGATVTAGGFPPPPAYNSAQLKTLPEGKMFHTITYGKGQMGSHSSQLNKLERWKIIQYVKVLQNDGKSPFAASAPADSTAKDSTKAKL